MKNMYNKQTNVDLPQQSMPQD